MILSFRDKRTAEFASGEFIRAFQGFDRQAYKRLDILAAATSLNDLRNLPSNRLEAMKGDRAGQYSIRINDQWRTVSSGRRTPRDRQTSKSWIITEGDKPMARPSIHPGE